MGVSYVRKEGTTFKGIFQPSLQVLREIVIFVRMPIVRILLSVACLVSMVCCTGRSGVQPLPRMAEGVLDLRYNDSRLAQGRDATKALLKDNPELCEEIAERITVTMASIPASQVAQKEEQKEADEG